MEIKKKRKMEAEVVWRRNKKLWLSIVRRTLISIVEKFIDGRSNSLGHDENFFRAIQLHSCVSGM